MARPSQRMETWAGPEYRVRQRFRAPLPYVFAWCTDYSPNDPRIEREPYERRVIERTGRRVILEELEDDGRQWEWNRIEVSLDPPRYWKAVGVGNTTDFIAEYRLTNVGTDLTELDLRWRRRYVRPPLRRKTKAERERSGRVHWGRFARALEADYRAGRPAVARRRRAR